MGRMSAFEYYLRTGRRLPEEEMEAKFNPWHDPDDGRFTFAGQGRHYGGGAERSYRSVARQAGAPRIRQIQQPSSLDGSSRFLTDVNEAIRRIERELDALHPAMRAIPGYAQQGTSQWRAANDHVFIKAAAKFNRQYKLKLGDPKYIDPLFVKAWAMVESGGSESAFGRDPLQVNNPGDWTVLKQRMTGLLSREQRMTPETSAVAALNWLEFRGYFRDNSGKPGPWIGFERALQRYNGRTTRHSSGVPHNVWYAREVLRLYDAARKSR